MLSVDIVTTAIEQAAQSYGAALAIWYPQHGDNAPAERNLTLHIALALKSAVPTVQVYAEASLGEASDARVDLLAYEAASRSLAVVEAKRFLEKSPGGLVDDIDRVVGFQPTNDWGKVVVDSKVGVLLTQSIVARNAAWWASAGTATPAPGKSPSWASLAEHLGHASERGRVGSRLVHRPSDRIQRHLLWCVWPCD